MATPCLSCGSSPTRQSGDKIRSGPQVGLVATTPMSSSGSPLLQSVEQNQKWPTSGPGGYITPVLSEGPNASKRGTKSVVAHKWAWWLHHPCRLGAPQRFRAGDQNQKWPTIGPGGLGVPNASERGTKIRSGPQVGLVAGGSPMLQSGGQNQKWRTSGLSDYITLAVRGVPNASQQGTKTEVAHKWAWWLHHPCQLGAPRRFIAGYKNRSGPQVGLLGTTPPSSRRSPTLQSGDKIRNGPQMGLAATTPMSSRGVSIASRRGTKSEGAHKWAWWQHHPCRSGGPQHFRAGDKIRNGPQMGLAATTPMSSRGVSIASRRGTKSEGAHKWAWWQHHPCRSGGPQHFRAGDKIRNGPQVGVVATSPLSSVGSPTLQSGGQNQKWPTNKTGGYIIPAVWEVPNASKHGTKSEVAQRWASWLHHPCHLGGPQRLRAGDKNRSGTQVGLMATSRLPSRGSPTLQSVEPNQKRLTGGLGGYITYVVWEVPNASTCGTKSEVAHK